MVDHLHDNLAKEISRVGVAILMGGVDTGKTTLGKQAARMALADGRTVAYVDADVSNSSVGPPACVGLKLLETLGDLERLSEPDHLHFVGTITASRLVLQQVVATAAVTDRARQMADLVIIDTTAVVSGVAG
ncbi:MAG: Clp1/GlmU family protein, partial [Acidimicrobiia bacterium]|nr:Clp1/GlmU family protein [Acidimicrobiia bacterium]